MTGIAMDCGILILTSMNDIGKGLCNYSNHKPISIPKFMNDPKVNFIFSFALFVFIRIIHDRNF